jgi:hypothetical protein
LAPSKLPRIVRSLVEAGWDIQAEGKIFRRPGAFRIEVSSGVDWFELHGEVEYGNTTARLPELLAALRRGDKMVRLDDGTYGMLPEEWLRRIGRFDTEGNTSEMETLNTEQFSSRLRERLCKTAMLDLTKRLIAIPSENHRGNLYEECARTLLGRTGQTRLR